MKSRRLTPAGPDEAVLRAGVRADTLSLTLIASGVPDTSATVPLARLPVPAAGEGTPYTDADARRFSEAVRDVICDSDLYGHLYTNLAADLQHPRWQRLALRLEGDDDAVARAGVLPWEALELWDPDRKNASSTSGVRPFLDGDAAFLRLGRADGPLAEDEARDADSTLRVLMVVGDYVQRDHRLEGVQRWVTVEVSDKVKALVHDTVDHFTSAAGGPGHAPRVEVVVLVPPGAKLVDERYQVEVDGLAEVRAWIAGRNPDRRAAGGFHIVTWIGHSDATSTKTGCGLAVHHREQDGFDHEPYPLEDLGKDLQRSGTRALILHCCRLDASYAIDLCGVVDHVIGWSTLVPPGRCVDFQRAFLGRLRDDPLASVADAVVAARRAHDLHDLLHYTSSLDSRGFVPTVTFLRREFESRMERRLRTSPFEGVLKTEVVPIDLHVALDVADHRGRDEQRFAEGVEDPRILERRHLAGWLEDRRCYGIALLGDPGAGKSTLLREHALEKLRVRELAIFLPIRELMESDVERLEDLHRLGGDYALLRPEVIDDARGEITLLFDALDEVPDPRAARERMEALWQHKAVRARVVSMRVVGAADHHADFRVLRVQLLDRERQDELFGNWFRTLLREAADIDGWTWLARQPSADDARRAVVDFLDKPEGRLIRHECQSPLMLTLMALRFAEEGPGRRRFQSRIDILDDAVRSFLLGEYRREGLFTADELPAVEDVLECLARELFESQQTLIVLLDKRGQWTEIGAKLAARLGGRGDSRTPRASEAASWRSGVEASLVRRLARTGLIGLDPASRIGDARIRFPLQIFADLFAARSLVREFRIDNAKSANIEGLLAHLRPLVAAARDRDEQREDGGQAPRQLARIAETMALVAHWLVGDDTKRDWLLGLHELDPALGLRALALTPSPPQEVLSKLLARAEAEEKQAFWDGFRGQFDLTDPAEAATALELLRRAADALRDGVNRFFIEEEAAAIAPEQGRLVRRPLDLDRQPRGVRWARIEDPEVWRRIAPDVIGYDEPTFGMGDDLVQVPVPGEFWLMAVPVTVGMFAAFDPNYRLRWNGKDIVVADVRLAAKRDTEHGADSPVTFVTWWDAVAFARSLNQLDTATLASALGVDSGEFEMRRAAGWKFRLPTEHEWEWACRAGTTTPFWCGKELSEEAAWFNQRGGVRPVARKRENPFGLFDVHGNAWDWVLDAYAASDPRRRWSGGERGSGRVLRGGSYWDGAELCRSAFRFRDRPALRVNFGSDGDIGFRVAFAAPLPSSDGVFEFR